MQYIYTQNQFLPADTAFISADDRSFRFGDGIFETLLLVNGKMYDAPAHFTRLQRGLDFFRIPLDISGLEAVCNELIARNQCLQGYVRVIVSRGDSAGVVGYMPGDAKPYCVVQTVEKSFPAYQHLSLCISQHRASLHAPCKINSAMLYTMAMMEARDAGADNALILDAHGHVCETASGNIFWLKNGVLYTPETGLPMVPGTMRARVLALAELPIQEGRFTLSELAQADEILMTNVGYILAAIRQIPVLGYCARSDNVTQEIRRLLEREIRG